jgi:hypothetical protein
MRTLMQLLPWVKYDIHGRHLYEAVICWTALSADYFANPVDIMVLPKRPLE